MQKIGAEKLRLWLRNKTRKIGVARILVGVLFTQALNVIVAALAAQYAHSELSRSETIGLFLLVYVGLALSTVPLAIAFRWVWPSRTQASDKSALTESAAKSDKLLTGATIGTGPLSLRQADQRIRVITEGLRLLREHVEAILAYTHTITETLWAAHLSESCRREEFDQYVLSFNESVLAFRKGIEQFVQGSDELDIRAMFRKAGEIELLSHVANFAACLDSLAAVGPNKLSKEQFDKVTSKHREAMERDRNAFYGWQQFTLRKLLEMQSDLEARDN